jgi:Tol biopolymer transport system component
MEDQLVGLTREAMSVDDARFAPAWCPDGTQVAYISNAADYWSDDVWIVDVATSEARQWPHGVLHSGVVAFR